MVSKFNPIRASSKFSICGLPLTGDTYRTCSFGCEYCFSNGRKININHKSSKVIDDPNLEWLEKKLEKIHKDKNVNSENFLEVLLKNDVTMHIGGLSDPFQPIEQYKQNTKKFTDITNKFDKSILFSTKGDDLYNWETYNPELHTFQLSVSSLNNLLEPNISSIEQRIEFYNKLKSKGFRVGIRLQPFIPGVTTLDIIDKFPEADNYTIEGLKIVPQNKEQKQFLFDKLNMSGNDFTQMGLLNLKPEIRLKAYGEFIDKFKSIGASYSIADNDLRYLGNNSCCCGDRLIKNSTNFNSTAVLMNVELDGYDDKMIQNIGEYENCNIKSLFTSNRCDKFKTIKEFITVKLPEKTHPCSKKFLYTDNTYK